MAATQDEQRLRLALIFLIAAALFDCPASYAESFASPDPNVDALVEECIDETGVRMIGKEDNVACFNDAIFPGSFFKFNALPASELTVITSPGGHVVTARIMSAVLDQRGGRVVIADQCASACAMMLTPAIEDLHIHRTAHFAIHGITILEHEEFGKWEEQRNARRRLGARSGFMQGLALGLGFSSGYYSGGRDQFSGHLKGQGIDAEYQTKIGERMLKEAEDYRCLYPPGDYWGLLDAEYLRTYLDDQISVMEDFVQTYDHPEFEDMRDVTKRIGNRTYIFEHSLGKGGCR